MISFRKFGLAATMIIATLSICASGCAESDINQQASKEPNVSSMRDENFMTHQKGATRFIELWRKSRKYRDEGKFREALVLMEEAYNKAAFGKAEKSIALEDMALSYEAMKDYELAANFYEGAAKMTMNPKQAAEFNQKAAELRKKMK